MADFLLHRGVYDRLRELLAERGRLDEWCACGAERTRKALLEWCEADWIVLAPEPAPEPGAP